MPRTSGAESLPALLDDILTIHNSEVKALRAEIRMLKADLDDPLGQRRSFQDSVGSAAQMGTGSENCKHDVARSSISSGTGGPRQGPSSRRSSARNVSEKLYHSSEKLLAMGRPSFKAWFKKSKTRSTSIVDTREPLLYRIARNDLFEAVFAGLIFLNTASMAAESQYEGERVGENQGFVISHVPVADSWHVAADCFAPLRSFFGVVFCLELAVKIVGLRREFFDDFIHWIDALCVGFFIAEVCGSTLGMNVQLIRGLRLIRLFRLVRLFRVFEATMDGLFLMTTAIRGSLKTLGWNILLFLIALTFFSLIMCQALTSTYMEDPKRPLDERQVLWIYFGTYTRALFTMFELTFANWPPVARLLTENVHSCFMIFTVLYKLTLGFAVVGVINAVFIQETFQVIDNDDEIMVRRRQRAEAAHREKMSLLFLAADVTGDGTLEMHEMRQVLQDPDARSWLAAMGFPIFDHVKDIDALFSTLDKDGSGEITMDELVTGVSHLRGAARSQDLHDVLLEVRSIKSGIRAMEDVILSSVKDSTSQSTRIFHSHLERLTNASRGESEAPGRERREDESRHGLMATGPEASLHETSNIASALSPQGDPPVCNQDLETDSHELDLQGDGGSVLV